MKLFLSHSAGSRADLAAKMGALLVKESGDAWQPGAEWSAEGPQAGVGADVSSWEVCKGHSCVCEGALPEYEPVAPWEGSDQQKAGRGVDKADAAAGTCARTLLAVYPRGLCCYMKLLPPGKGVQQRTPVGGWTRQTTATGRCARATAAAYLHSITS